MYETMVFLETAHEMPDLPPHILDWARQWQGAEEVVYSRTLAEPRSARTRIERTFDADAVRRLKDGSEHDLTVDGPELAAHAIRAAWSSCGTPARGRAGVLAATPPSDVSRADSASA